VSILPPENAGQAEPPDVLGYIFAPRRARNVRAASQVSESTRKREIFGYLRANPNSTREQARKATADLRRRGYLPETVIRERATPEQQYQAGNYQRRQASAQQSAETRLRLRTTAVAVVSYTSDENGYLFTTELLIRGSDLSRADRREAARHRNIVHAYMRHGDNPENVRKLMAYQGKGVTDRSTGVFIPFEYDPNRIDVWYLTTYEGGEFNPEDYYREMSGA
jgi:hypothetical protein